MKKKPLDLTPIIKLFITITGVVCCVGLVSKYSAEYYMEQAKQDATMMKACVDNGNQWVKNFGPTWNCERMKVDN